MPAESASMPHIGVLARTRDRGRAEERFIAELAERQHGVVTRQQLLELGFGRRGIERRIHSRRLNPLYPGVYAVGHRIIYREGRWMAAVLASGPDAILSHWSAAALWMIRPNSRTRIDVTVPRPTRSSKQIRRHVSEVPEDERTAEEGIPVTTVPRTIFDLAATESVDVVKELLRESEFRQLYDRLSLWDLIERYPGHRGVRKARAALERTKEEPSGRKRSRLEERFALFLRQHHLPQPRFNDWIAVGKRNFQVDCHWPGTGEIVELDGWEGHGTKSAFRDDRTRDRALRVAGYSVTRLTWNQLDDEPAAIAADLGALLGNHQAR